MHGLVEEELPCVDDEAGRSDMNADRIKKGGNQGLAKRSPSGDGRRPQ